MKHWQMSDIGSLIVDVPNFPKMGIMFKDITPIFANGAAFQSLAMKFAEKLPSDVTHLCAIESRGFIIAAAVAQHREISLVLARKPGKLPRETVSHKYDLEYGSDSLLVHKDSFSEESRVVIIDDVLATGGTASAAETLVKKCGAQVVAHLFLMELKALEGGARLKAPYHAFLKF